MTGTASSRYSGTMETVAAGGDAVETQGNEGRQREAEMMAWGGPYDRTRNIPQYLWQVGDGIPPWRNGHMIAPKVTLAGGRHGYKQKRVGEKSRQ